MESNTKSKRPISSPRKLELWPEIPRQNAMANAQYMEVIYDINEDCLECQMLLYCHDSNQKNGIMARNTKTKCNAKCTVHGSDLGYK